MNGSFFLPMRARSSLRSYGSGGCGRFERWSAVTDCPIRANIFVVGVTVFRPKFGRAVSAGDQARWWLLSCLVREICGRQRASASRLGKESPEPLAGGLERTLLLL